MTEVGFGMVASEIVAAAERHDSELMVLGRTGAGLGRWLRIGSAARHVLHTARCAVLVVTEPEDALDQDTGAR
jgi:nucleotide-binding universal stress UspA family protein